MVASFVIVALACLVYYYYYYCTRTLNYWQDKNVAGPKPMPCFGNLLESALRKKHLGIVYKEIYDEYPKEKIIGIYRMTSPTLIIRDLDVVKNILVKDFPAFPSRGIEFSKEGLGGNLFHCGSGLNPLTNSVQRSVAQDYKIPGMDVVIEKGTTVIISPYAIHRDEINYPDANKFEPERFSNENSRERHPCAYIPFGAGPRSCIGRQLAKLQYAVAMVKVLSKFEIKPSTKTTTIADYDPMRTLIATKGGIFVNLVPRK